MQKQLVVLLVVAGCGDRKPKAAPEPAPPETAHAPDPGQAALADFRAWVAKVYTEESRTFERDGFRGAGTTSRFTTNCKMTTDVRATNQVAQPYEGIVKSNSMEVVFQRQGAEWVCDKARTTDSGCDVLYAMCARDSPMVRDEKLPAKASAPSPKPVRSRPRAEPTRETYAPDPDRFVHRRVGSFEEAPRSRPSPSAPSAEPESTDTKGQIADPFAE